MIHLNHFPLRHTKGFAPNSVNLKCSLKIIFPGNHNVISDGQIFENLLLLNFSPKSRLSNCKNVNMSGYEFSKKLV